MQKVFQNIPLNRLRFLAQAKGASSPFSLPGKKRVQQGLALCGQNAALIVRAAAVRQIEQPQHAADSAFPRIGRAVKHPADSAVDDGAGAHGAGFQRYI